MRKLTIAALTGLATATATPSLAKETITYGYLLDPSLEGVLYAIKQGIVKSDKIKIEATALSIPALIRSTPAKRFDVIMNAVMAIPFAKRRGIDLVVLSTALRAAKGGLGAGIWVRKDSPFKTIADLKGKSIGNYALRSTGTTWIRMPAPTLLAALESKKIEAATLIHAQAYKARQMGKYRVLAWTNRDIKKKFGVYSVAAVNVTYPEKLEARPEAFMEFNRMLRASVLYAVKNADAVGKAISKKFKISPAFFKAWLNNYSFFPGAVSAQDMKAMETVWQNAKEMGILKKVPKAADVVWKHAVRE